MNDGVRLVVFLVFWWGGFVLLLAWACLVIVRQVRAAVKAAGGADVGSRGMAWSAILPAQLQLGLIWAVFAMFSCGTERQVEIMSRVAWWLPLNYVIVDAYLLLRGGGSTHFWRRLSRAAAIILVLSPVAMLLTTPFLGMAGTSLYKELFW